MIQSLRIFSTLIFVCCFMNLYAQEKVSTSEHSKKTKSIVVKELDEFHELLHPLVHEAMPNKDFAAVRKALLGLVDAANAMKKAKLPKGLTAKKDSYKKESGKLVREIIELNKMKDKFSDKKLENKFMEMHDTFENIMGMVR